MFIEVEPELMSWMAAEFCACSITLPNDDPETRITVEVWQLVLTTVVPGATRQGLVEEQVCVQEPSKVIPPDGADR